MAAAVFGRLRGRSTCNEPEPAASLPGREWLDKAIGTRYVEARGVPLLASDISAQGDIFLVEAGEIIVLKRADRTVAKQEFVGTMGAWRAGPGERL